MEFIVNEKKYSLDKSNLDAFLNDEERPIKDLNADDILNILEGRDLDFEVAYYESICEKCKSKIEGIKRAYRFLEYHFYLYTKDDKLVISSLEAEDEGKTFTKMQRLGEVDNSYIVSIIVCAECGVYTIEIEEFEI